MRASQWKAALALAKTRRDFTAFDDSPMYGCGLPDFKYPVYVPLGAVARFMQWQGACLDGSWDEKETAENRPSLLKKIEISDWFTTAEAVEYQHDVVRKLVEGPEYAMGSTGIDRAD